jgi:hypothetical protein
VQLLDLAILATHLCITLSVTRLSQDKPRIARLPKSTPGRPLIKLQSQSRKQQFGQCPPNLKNSAAYSWIGDELLICTDEWTVLDQTLMVHISHNRLQTLPTHLPAITPFPATAAVRKRILALRLGICIQSSGYPADIIPVAVFTTLTCQLFVV